VFLVATKLEQLAFVLKACTDCNYTSISTETEQIGSTGNTTDLYSGGLGFQSQRDRRLHQSLQVNDRITMTHD
jgi:hypothetical protein